MEPELNSETFAMWDLLFNTPEHYFEVEKRLKSIIRDRRSFAATVIGRYVANIALHDPHLRWGEGFRVSNIKFDDLVPIWEHVYDDLTDKCGDVEDDR